jgi:predicted Zn-dependent protease
LSCDEVSLGVCSNGVIVTTDTIREVAPSETWITHGREEALLHWCMTHQYRARALALVDEGVALYPEFTLLQVTRGRLLDAAGRTEEAVVAWSAAHDLNPYDPAVQAALVRGYEAIGDAAAAARHAGYARILATGGARP